MKERTLLSAKETAAMLGVSQRTLYNLTRAGKLPAVRIGRRVLYRPADVEAYITSQLDGYRQLELPFSESEGGANG